MSDDQKPGPSTLTCALVGIGGAAAAYGVMCLFTKKDVKIGALHGAANELERATRDYDVAFRRLLAAEEALEPISKAFRALAWEDVDDAHRSHLRAAQSEVKTAKTAADAAMKRMREWREVVQLERKPATTEAGREAQRLLNELEDLSRPSRGN
jgi:hypothetical protein